MKFLNWVFNREDVTPKPMTPQVKELNWPPPYKIRKHKRARHVKLRATKLHGLEVTIPYRFSMREIPAILNENKTWILKQLDKLAATQSATLPEQVHFQAINRIYRIHYMACAKRLQLIERPQQEIVLLGNIENKEACQKKLKQWIKAQAKIHLPALLAATSNQTQLTFSQAAVRDQQTLWGSCTAKKAISLNYKLLFLPEKLAKHVLIHELCHTKYLNHSVRFWNLVAAHDADWQIHKLALRHADQHVPNWI